LGKPEHSVRGRAIEILRDTGRVIEPPAGNEKGELQKNEESATSSEQMNRDSGESSDEAVQGMHVKPANGKLYLSVSLDHGHVPQPVSANQHIAFLENQRNPKDKSTLRIPSPREFDEGGKPEDVGDESANDGLSYSTTNSPTEPRRHINFELDSRVHEPTADVPHITIDESNTFRSREKASTLPRMNQKQPTNRSLEPPERQTKPTLRGTFSSIRR